MDAGVASPVWRVLGRTFFCDIVECAAGKRETQNVKPETPNAGQAKEEKEAEKAEEEEKLKHETAARRSQARFRVEGSGVRVQG